MPRKSRRGTNYVHGLPVAVPESRQAAASLPAASLKACGARVQEQRTRLLIVLIFCPCFRGPPIHLDQP